MVIALAAVPPALGSTSCASIALSGGGLAAAIELSLGFGDGRMVRIEESGGATVLVAWAEGARMTVVL
jgi:hypothetical protein